MPVTLSITRIINACVLIELGEDVVLSDPFFNNRWFMRFNEPIGMRVEQLPKLSAIIGGHGVLDHWQPESLGDYPFKPETPVFVATPAMEKKARASQFTSVEMLDWNVTRKVSEALTLESVPAQTATGMKVNNYVLSAHGLRIFVGTEARDLEPLRQYRKNNSPVDIALLPIDGSSLMGHKLVMDADDAIQASQLLGAKILIPIHYAMKSIPLLLQTPTSLADLLRHEHADLEVIPLETGKRWCWQGQTDKILI